MQQFSKKLVVLSLMLLSFSFARAQDAKQQKRERIQTAYMFSFGRVPTESEISYWQGRADAKTISDMVGFNKTYLNQDATTKRNTIIKAYNDAMGRNPGPAEITYWSKGANTYTDLMKAHIQWLGGNPGEYENVIKRSYQFVLGRQPSAGEISYWRGQGIHSYVVLIGCHEAWKKSNGATAQKTSGSSSLVSGSPLIAQVSLSPQIAIEARSFAGIVAQGGGNIVAAGGGNIVAQGGGNIVAAGGGNIVAQGGGN